MPEEIVPQYINNSLSAAYAADTFLNHIKAEIVTSFLKFSLLSDSLKHPHHEVDSINELVSICSTGSVPW